MILARDLWNDEEWQLPTDEAAWMWAQDHLPHVMEHMPRSIDDLIQAVNRNQNWEMVRQGHQEADALLPQVSAIARAAKLLRDGDTSDPAWHAALVVDEDDREAAALAACGVPVTEDARAALRGLSSIQPATPVGKAEVPGISGSEPPSGPVVSPVGDDQDGILPQVEQALKAGAVRRPTVHDKPKHFNGAWLVRAGGEDLLLKPGSGPQSPAAGVREEPASQPRREAAAWHALSAMGLGGWAPRCDLLTIGGKEYACERWLGAQARPAADVDRVRLLHDWRPLLASGALHRLAAALWILGQPDGHGHNVLVEGDEQSPILIDFGSALAGDGFEPEIDPCSYTPFVLRSWTPDGYGRMPPADRLQKLPRLSREAAEQLRAWIVNVDSSGVIAALYQHGVMTEPTASRISRLKAAACTDEADLAVNKTWTVGIP